MPTLTIGSTNDTSNFGQRIPVTAVRFEFFGTSARTFSMPPIFLIWLAFSALASVLLLSLMRRQQSKLHGLLVDHVEQQKAWMKKKAKAAKMVKQAAIRKEAEEEAFLASQKAVLANAEMAMEASQTHSKATSPEPATP